MSNRNKFTAGLAVVLLLLIGAVYLSACGSDWIVPTDPAFPLPPGCWQVEDPVVVVNSSNALKVTSIQCPPSDPTDPTNPTNPTDPTDPPSDPVVDAGTPTDGGYPGTPNCPPDAPFPPGCGNDDNDPYVRYNPKNGKCYKINSAQLNSNGQHRGWVIVTNNETNCPNGVVNEGSN